jgi:CTP-dependent riboflavin kinase
MSSQWILTGKIVGGVGEAAYFTGLDWVQKQCAEKLHFKPYPGTLNIEVDESSLPVLEDIQKSEGIKLLSPDHNFCNARSLKASLKNVIGAIIIPDEEVHIHGKNIVEIIAPLSLKETLHLENGDEVELLVEQS